jgi:tetratricopeptide (TPR) repeat protein
MTPRLRAVFFLLIGLAATAAARGDTPPWETQPFAADGKDVIKAAAASAAADQSDVVVLFEEGRFRFEPDGRCDYRYHIVYRIQTEAGVRAWSSIGSGWAPWFEQKPELRARVTTPDGRSRALDPQTIAEAPVSDDDPDVFSDRRRVRAPLPAVGVGAVVEEEIRVADRTPLFTAGTQYRFLLGSSVPVRRLRVTVDAPEALPLHHLLRGLEGLTVEREREAGRVRLKVEAGPLAPVATVEPWMPSDRPRRPYFAFSTGSSWQSVAEAYAKAVDAQIATPLPAPRPGLRREEVAARLVKRLHEEVRYTGVEFGEAALVPRPPADVLSRRYGDCKDKSALLVSRLRAEGVSAHIALLLAAPGADVDPDLPGLGLFNHAIVVLPGTPTLWIDATDEFSRVGELPVGDQDRLVLVATPGTTALVKTPASRSADNTLRKTREYLLAEKGAGRVVETTQATGAIEREYRSFYAQSDPKALRESQEKYARAEHAAGTVLGAESANPRDLSVPFRVRIESGDAGRGETNGTSAAVTIATAGLFTELPGYVAADPEDGGPAEPRRQPFVQLEPHRVEWSYRIVPPAGFVPKRLPEPEKAQLGPASLDVRFDKRADGVVEGKLAFDSGPRVLEAKAFDELRDGIRKWRAREPLRVEFEDKSQSLLGQGRVCEALAELRQAVSAQPKRAGPHERSAETLLAAGFGEAAREEARRAVALDPRSSSAERVLGWTLEHDALGRRFKKGWDRAGAEAAYRKAKELDPKSVIARASLAILFEHDDFGVHFGDGANLAEAAKEARALRADLASPALDTNLLIDLARLGKLEEAEALARSLPAEGTRNDLLLTVIAARRGARAGVDEAAKLFSDPDKRRDGLLHAGNSLLELRLYKDGAALVAESAAGSPEAATRRARADLFGRVRRYEELKWDDADPRTAVRRLFVAVAEHLAGVGDPKALFDLVATSEADRRDALRDPDAFRRGVVSALRASAGSPAFNRGLVDVVLAVGEMSVEGDAQNGYRVRQRLGDQSHSMYVVRRDGRLRVLATCADGEALGAEAWRLVDEGELAAARRWLDWAKDEIAPVADDDPLAGPPFGRLWRRDGGRGADAVRVAAASLFGSPARIGQAIQVLTVWRDAQPDGPARQDVDAALLPLLVRADRPADALKVAERLFAAYPASKTAWTARAEMLGLAGRHADARALAQERLRQKPDDPAALRVLASLASRAGQYDEAERALARLASSGQAEVGDLNNRAWIAVLRGVVDDPAVEWAQRAAQSGAPASLHTLATVYAEKGRAKEAQQVLAQSIAAGLLDEPRSDDWYVVGRLAEQCSLGDEARRAYGRVEADKAGRLDATAVLAGRGLARLSTAKDGKARAGR